MAWLDDRAWAHPKLTLLSDGAFRAWVSGVCYSSGFGLGGRLEREHQVLIGASQKVRRELITVDLWHELDEGAVQIHDWEEHNDKRDAKRATDRDRKRKQRDKERDTTRDSERDIQRDETGLKEVKNDRVTSVELANASPTAQSLVAEYVEAIETLGAKAESRSKGMVAQRIGQLLGEGHEPETISGAIHLMVDRRLHPSTLPTLLLEAAAGPARKRRELSELDQDFVHFAGGSA